MPWSLFDRFYAAGERIRRAIQDGTDTSEAVREQHAILAEEERNRTMYSSHFPAWPDPCETSWRKRLAARWRLFWRRFRRKRDA